MSVNEKMTAIADAIREKTGDPAKLSVDAMAENIRKLPAPIVNTASGSTISLTDSTDLKLRGLRLFGKTTQDGNPTPEEPVFLESVGNSGSMTVKVETSETDENPQIFTITTPNGLRGISVSSGGNYTDGNGKKWVCDEIDFARGVYVQRIGQTNVHIESLITSFYDTQYVNVCYGQMQHPADASFKGTAANLHPILCESAKIGRKVFGFDNADNVGYCLTDATNYAFWFCFPAGTSLEEIKAKLDGTKMLYQLATPIETPLSFEELEQYNALHTNYPNTTIYNDAGAYMEVKYVADTKLYIDKKFAELSTALLNQ